MSIDRWIHTVSLRVRSLLRGRRVEDELQEELQFHLDQRACEELAHGVSADEARRNAVLAFGGRAQVAEACRDARGVASIEHLIQDVRYAARVLRHEAAFTVVIVLTLAVGIGANAAVFSVVDGVLLRPVPFPDMDRLMMVWGTERNSGSRREPVSIPDFFDFAAATAHLQDLAAFSGSDVNVALDGMEPIRAPALAVTQNLLPLTGTPPLVGQLFEPGDDRPGGRRVVLIGEALWDRLFARNPAVLGRTVLLNGTRYTVTGVVPRDAAFGFRQALSAAGSGRGFADRAGPGDVDIWLPLVMDVDAFPRYRHHIFLVGRLMRTATVAQAQRELDITATKLGTLYKINHQRGVHVEPLSAVVFGRVRLPLLVLLGTVGFVLLLACANVANLMLARGSTRARDVAVRVALGATRGRLSRQWFVEAVLLTLGATLVGIILAFFTLQFLLALAPDATPRIGAVTISGRVLAIMLLVSLVEALAFSLLPTLQGRRLDLNTVLRNESSHVSAGREGARLRRGLAVAQVALAVVLLIGAGLLLRSFWNLQRVDPGVRTHGTLKAEFQLSGLRYPVDDWPRLTAVDTFNGMLLERVAALPGVQSATIARNHPFDAGSTNAFTIVGREHWSQGLPEASIRSVSPGYFASLDVHLLSGRGLAEGDRTGSAPVIVLNEAAARALFPAGDAIDQRIAVWGARRSVVGIVSNERILGLAVTSPPAIYAPLAQVPPRDGHESLIVRAHADPERLVGPLRALFRDLDPEIALFGIEPLTHTVSRSIAPQRFTAVLVGAFATVGVVLALIGVHGVLRFAVAQRRREMGICMALGADERRIVHSLMVEGMGIAFAGLALGLALAAALSRLLSTMLHEVSPSDPVTIAAVTFLIGGTVFVTCWFPARAASRMDPVKILRES